MDNLKSLIEQKNYNLVIKLTNNSTNVDDLFYRLSAFTAKGDIDHAINLIDKNSKILETKLPFLMQTHIELLCLAKRFDEAYEKIKYYENLPYYSQQAEEILKELPSIVRHYERSLNNSKYLDEDELIKDLLSNDDQIVLAALDNLKEVDIKPYLIYISKILSSYPKQSIRSFALLLLVHKKLDNTFDFLHINKIIKVNPSRLNPPFVGKDFENLIKRMDECFRDPSISKNALSILSSYVIYVYPEEVDYSNQHLLDAVRYVACKYLSVDLPEIDTESKELVNKIETVLNE